MVVPWAAGWWLSLEGRDLLWAGLALVAALVAGAVLIALADRWYRRSRQDPAAAGEQLAHFRLLYERGELSREEFDRIKTQLGDPRRQETDVQTPKPAKPAEASPRPPEPPDGGIRPA